MFLGKQRSDGMRVLRAEVLSGLFLGLLTPVWGLNPIHEGGFALWHRSMTRADWRAEGGAAFASGQDAVAIPLALSVRLADNVELGAGLKTVWGDVGDPIPYAPLGVKISTGNSLTVNVDFLVATSGGDHGLRAGLLKRIGHGRRLSSRISGQIGFLDAFVNDAPMAFEAAWIPALHFGRGLSVECGLVASSQFSDFNDYFALDLQPALSVGLGNDGAVLSQVTVGLAGERREDLRVKIALARGF
jgi:hypothetical protein